MWESLASNVRVLLKDNAERDSDFVVDELTEKDFVSVAVGGGVTVADTDALSESSSVNETVEVHDAVNESDRVRLLPTPNVSSSKHI